MMARNDAIEFAVVKLIKARLFDEAAWISERLAARRRGKMLRRIVAAI